MTHLCLTAYASRYEVICTVKLANCDEYKQNQR
jgi:hypothetical protein